MRLRHTVYALSAAILLLAAPARAELVIEIDKSAQQMIVSVDGDPRYVWPVSTGLARGYDTPAGTFKPFRMERDHFSREWDDAPMPHSIFFTQHGHAIHGSNYVRQIGQPASHGCVRLEPKNAALLFGLVKQHKMSNTRVVLSGVTPASGDAAVARRASPPNRRQQQNAGTFYQDEDLTGAQPLRRERTARNWRDGRDEPPRYYYRARPYDERRYERYGYDERRSFDFFGR